MEVKDFKSPDQIAWCPGCGNFGILLGLKNALVELNKQPKDVLLVSGIGQAAKLPHYIRCNCFNGLHGRSLPVATGAKLANRNLTVVVTTGDGDCYGEGGNHFLHAMRRNIDITVIVHDNQIYGLTKGQASPTTDPGYKTKVQSGGVVLNPLRPLEMAITLGAGFVARGFSKEQEHLTQLIVAGVKHKGFSLIDVLQPCVTYNKANTYDWYTERVYKVEDESDYDVRDKVTALRRAGEWGERIPIGILYHIESQCYEDRIGLPEGEGLVDQDIGQIDITAALEQFV